METFVFDFNQSIYGQSVESELVQLLRPDQTFSGMEEMRQQIAKDCEPAQRILV